MVLAYKYWVVQLGDYCHIAADFHGSTGVDYVLLVHAAFCPDVFYATQWVISGGKLGGCSAKHLTGRL
jgi:hypothetical protein